MLGHPANDVLNRQFQLGSTDAVFACAAPVHGEE